LINSQIEIEESINGCLQDNRKAQEKLYRGYYRAMMNLCLRYTQNDADAMEVLNTGFYKIFKTIGRYNQHKSSFYTWISTIMINTCIDFIKARKITANKMSLNEESAVAIPPEAITRMDYEELLLFIKELAPATKAVFNLFVIEGYGHKEIGEILQMNENTSKWHLSEARKKLQKIIQKKNE
jgi:RNA polymerase sigma factor (sigma-70 family)